MAWTKLNWESSNCFSSFVFADVSFAYWTGVGGVLIWFAAEEAGGARPAAEEAAGQADHPPRAGGFLANIRRDLEQDQVLW